jgi:hypothetical protein
VIDYFQAGKVLDSFDHHAPDAETVERIHAVRKACKDAALVIMCVVKPSADRTVALLKLHEAMMNANKSLVLEKL